MTTNSKAKPLAIADLITDHLTAVDHQYRNLFTITMHAGIHLMDTTVRERLRAGLAHPSPLLALPYKLM